MYNIFELVLISIFFLYNQSIIMIDFKNQIIKKVLSYKNKSYNQK